MATSVRPSVLFSMVLVILAPQAVVGDDCVAENLLSPGAPQNRTIPFIRWECPNAIPLGFAETVDATFLACLDDAKSDWAATHADVGFATGSNIKFQAAYNPGRVSAYLDNYGYITSLAMVIDNDDKSWACACGNQGQWDLGTLLLHELGHAVGLNLEELNTAVTACSWETTVMHRPQLVSDCENILGTIDAPAVQMLYGQAGSCPQLYVSRSGVVAAATSVCLCASNNPAARVARISHDAGRLSWNVLFEHDTYMYFVEGCDDPNGPGEILLQELPGTGLHSVKLPAPKHAYYRLVEIEADGARVIHDVVSSRDVSDRRRRKLPNDRGSRVESIRMRAETDKSQIIEATPQPFTYVIFTLDPYYDDVRLLVEDYWESKGERVSVVDLTTYAPQDRVQIVTDLIDLYHTAYQTKYFHIVADDGDEFATTLWDASQYWETMRSSYEEQGYAPEGYVPDAQRIPTHRIPDDVAGPDNTAQTQPYLLSDQPYADLDGDGVPDVVVTRWPVSDPSDVAIAAEKMRRHNATAAFGPRGAVFLVDDVDKDGPGTGELVTAMAQLVAEAMSATNPEEIIEYLFVSELVDFGARQDSTAALLNWRRPEIVSLLGTASNQHSPAHFFGGEYEDFGLDRLVEGNIVPLVAASSCHTACWTCADTQNTGRPVCEDFLFELEDRGAVAWVGPTAGSWQDANYLMTLFLAEELLGNPTRPMAESWLVALQRAHAIFSSNPDNLATIRSYVFLGDPLSPFRPTPAASITTKVVKSDGSQLPLPENYAIGCPQGDEDRIVITVTIDSTGLGGPIPASALSVTQPEDSTIVFYEVLADSAASLVNGSYRTTISIDHFGGCGQDSADIQLHGLSIGATHVRVSSPDHVFLPSESSTWGEITLEDFSFFGSHFPSSPCNCVYSEEYHECANYGPGVGDTLVDLVDFQLFGNNWQHGYQGGPGGSSHAMVELSRGVAEISFEEDYPLRGPRRLTATVTLRGVEQYEAAIIALRNENPILSFNKWIPSRDYASPTMCGEIHRRTGSPEILLGVVGGKGTEGTIVLGAIEMNILSTEPMQLVDRDLAIVDMRILDSGGRTLAFRGSQLRRIEQPTSFANVLAQNYPNPFNPSTTISFSIAKTSMVVLDIFNVRGQHVRTLVRGQRVPNNYHLTWDARNEVGTAVASGIYFYRMTAGAFTATRKMVLIR